MRFELTEFSDIYYFCLRQKQSVERATIVLRTALVDIDFGFKPRVNYHINITIVVDMIVMLI